MSARRLDMHRLQELVRLHRMGTGSRAICRLLEMSPKTELKYRTAFAGAELLVGDPDVLPSIESLRTVVDRAYPPAEPRPVTTSVERWMPVIEAGYREGVKAKAIWDKLRRSDPEFEASYSAVLRVYRRLSRARGIRPEDVVIPVETQAGEVAQVDFGYAGKLFDPETGRQRKAWVFVMVLAFSRHMFAKLVFDQKTDTWLRLHAEGFAFFGGVPRVIVPDNLKAAVVRGAFGSRDRHKLGLNRSYRELARFYGFKIDPTPTYSPEKKGKVESAVGYVKHNAVPTLEGDTIDALNVDLVEWVRRTAGTRIHGTTGCKPLQLFEERERGVLLPLPSVRFEPLWWKKAKVHSDCHVEFQRKLYSVPWRFVGQRIWIRASHHSLEMYADDVRIATHERLRRGRRSTQEAHLPEHRRDLRFRSEGYWVERAGKLSPEIQAYIQSVFDSDDVLAKLRDVQAIVTHLEQYPLHRAEGAVRRADFYGNYTYAGIRRILRRALDLRPLPTLVIPNQGSGTEPRFARSTAELLAKHMEADCEPN